jgi:hypothetical protein
MAYGRYDVTYPETIEINAPRSTVLSDQAILSGNVLVIRPTQVHACPSTRLPTDTPAHRTPNTKHRTPNTEHRTPNTEHRTPNTEHRTPNDPFALTLVQGTAHITGNLIDMTRHGLAADGGPRPVREAELFAGALQSTRLLRIVEQVNASAITVTADTGDAPSLLIELRNDTFRLTATGALVDMTAERKRALIPTLSTVHELPLPLSALLPPRTDGSCIVCVCCRCAHWRVAIR